MPSVDRSAAEHGVHARRVIFIDLARALAVVLMLYGHTISSLLAPAYRSGPLFDVWQFQRGLTSSLFLLLSGFAFSIATTRHWASHLSWSPAVARRIRRFSFFVLLGYGLHFPVPDWTMLATMGDARWRAFLGVDVLQLVGTTFLVVQALAMLSRSRRVFMVVTFALGVATMAATPWAWGRDWTQTMPLWVASFMSQATGSQFPVFPFASSILVGAAAGQLYARWGASDLLAFTNRVLFGGGAVFTALGLLWRLTHYQLFGGGPGAFMPGEFSLRTGVSLVILGAIAHGSRRLTHLPHLFGAVAQESLLIYFIHLCVVYGSVWNPGLVQLFGETLSPLQTLPLVVVLITAMVLLAWWWNSYKHRRPREAWWCTLAAWALLVLRLL